MTTLTTTWLTGADWRLGVGTGASWSVRGGVRGRRRFSRQLASGAKWSRRRFRRRWASVSGGRRRLCAESWLKGASGCVVDADGEEFTLIPPSPGATSPPHISGSGLGVGNPPGQFINPALESVNKDRFAVYSSLSSSAVTPALMGNAAANATVSSVAEDHHIIFQALYESTSAHPLDFSEEAIAVFRSVENKLLNAPGHRAMSLGHYAYNAAVRAATIQWLTDNGLTATALTKDQARNLIQHIRNSPTPAIRDFLARILARATGAAGAGAATAANAAGRAGANTAARRIGSWFRVAARIVFAPYVAAIQEVITDPTPTAGTARLPENTLMRPPSSPDLYYLPLGTIILPTGEIYIPGPGSTYVPPSGSVVVIGPVIGSNVGNRFGPDQVVPYVHD